ncbi:MAG TPA: hypothetical protein VE130_00760 [Nitrososphaeraceae archaeon]|nr:hypothetical protein [Nitrososphaeraceae archaeon]
MRCVLPTSCCVEISLSQRNSTQKRVKLKFDWCRYPPYCMNSVGSKLLLKPSLVLEEAAASSLFALV